MTDIKWIKYADEKPMETGEYLVTVKVGNEYVVDLADWIESSMFNPITKEYEKKVIWMINNDWDEGQGIEIIAWMNLPKPLMI